MIRFIDFVPERMESQGFLSLPTYESMEETTDHLNYWKEENPQYKIISIETILLPSLHSSQMRTSIDSHFLVRRSRQRWQQVIRVWYETEEINAPHQDNDFV